MDHAFSTPNHPEQDAGAGSGSQQPVAPSHALPVVDVLPERRGGDACLIAE